jgi:uncharacterized protein
MPQPKQKNSQGNRKPSRFITTAGGLLRSPILQSNNRFTKKAHIWRRNNMKNSSPNTKGRLCPGEQGIDGLCPAYFGAPDCHQGAEFGCLGQTRVTRGATQALLWGAIACLACFFAAAGALAQPVSPPEVPRAQSRPALTVHGQGEVSVRPDRALVQLGAEAQASEAVVAQQNVNRIMERAIKQIRNTGIPVEAIQTSGLQLFPVYGQQGPRGDRQAGQETLIGYRAANMLRIRVDDIDQAGQVIDAGMAAGANRLHGVSFDIKQELPHRTKALQLAVEEARAKAQAIARALGQPLGPVRHVAEEGGVGIPRPFGMERAMAVATPVQPGELQVQASVTMVFDLVPPQ